MKKFLLTIATILLLGASCTVDTSSNRELGASSITNPTLWKIASDILSPISPSWSVNTSTISGVFLPSNGGTGTSTAPSSGDLLIGNSSGTYDLVSSSSLFHVTTETDPIWTAASSSYLTTTTASTTYVPYTGATSDVDLGANELITEAIHANTSAGLHIHNTSHQDIAIFGAGGGLNATFYDGVKLNAGTASTILSLDSSKNIVGLSTSTYPSLTELSYVKGVTSAIQTQINTVSSSIITDHGGLTGLSDDDHTQYALLAGRGTSQTLYGGTNTTGVLALQGSSSPSTSNSDYGLILKNGVRNMIAISNNSIINFGGKVQSSYNNAFAGTTLFENALYVRDSVSTGSGTQTYVYGWLASGYRPLLAGNYSDGKVEYIASGGTQGHRLLVLNRSSDFEQESGVGTYGLTLATTDPNSNGQHHVGIATRFNGTGTYDQLNLRLLDSASNSESNFINLYSSATYKGTSTSGWRIRKDFKTFGQSSQWDIDSAQQYGMQVNHTWNNSGTAYYGFQLNITNTASSLSSEVFGINIGGSSVFYLNRTGNIYATGNFLTNGNVEGYNFTVNGALTLNNPILLNGGMESLIITKTADFNFFDSYYTTEVDTSSAGADITGTLQASPMTGIIMYITLIDATHNLIIDGNGNNIIDSTGSHTSITLSSFGTVMIQYNGTNWIVKS